MASAPCLHGQNGFIVGDGGLRSSEAYTVFGDPHGCISHHSANGRGSIGHQQFDVFFREFRSILSDATSLASSLHISKFSLVAKHIFSTKFRGETLEEKGKKDELRQRCLDLNYYLYILSRKIKKLWNTQKECESKLETMVKQVSARGADLRRSSMITSAMEATHIGSYYCASGTSTSVASESRDRKGRVGVLSNQSVDNQHFAYEAALEERLFAFGEFVSIEYEWFNGIQQALFHFVKEMRSTTLLDEPALKVVVQFLSYLCKAMSHYWEAYFSFPDAVKVFSQTLDNKGDVETAWTEVFEFMENLTAAKWTVPVHVHLLQQRLLKSDLYKYHFAIDAYLNSSSVSKDARDEVRSVRRLSRKLPERFVELNRLQRLMRSDSHSSTVARVDSSGRVWSRIIRSLPHLSQIADEKHTKDGLVDPDVAGPYMELQTVTSIVRLHSAPGIVVNVTQVKNRLYQAFGVVASLAKIMVAHGYAGVEADEETATDLSTFGIRKLLPFYPDDVDIGDDFDDQSTEDTASIGDDVGQGAVPNEVRRGRASSSKKKRSGSRVMNLRADAEGEPKGSARSSFALLHTTLEQDVKRSDFSSLNTGWALYQLLQDMYQYLRRYWSDPFGARQVYHMSRVVEDLLCQHAGRRSLGRAVSPWSLLSWNVFGSRWWKLAGSGLPLPSTHPSVTNVMSSLPSIIVRVGQPISVLFNGSAVARNMAMRTDDAGSRSICRAGYSTVAYNVGLAPVVMASASTRSVPSTVATSLDLSKQTTILRSIFEITENEPTSSALPLSMFEDSHHGPGFYCTTFSMYPLEAGISKDRQNNDGYSVSRVLLNDVYAAVSRAEMETQSSTLTDFDSAKQRELLTKRLDILTSESESPTAPNASSSDDSWKGSRPCSLEAHGSRLQIEGRELVGVFDVIVVVDGASGLLSRVSADAIKNRLMRSCIEHLQECVDTQAVVRLLWESLRAASIECEQFGMCCATVCVIVPVDRDLTTTQQMEQGTRRDSRDSWSDHGSGSRRDSRDSIPHMDSIRSKDEVKYVCISASVGDTGVAVFSPSIRRCMLLLPRDLYPSCGPNDPYGQLGGFSNSVRHVHYYPAIFQSQRRLRKKLNAAFDVARKGPKLVAMDPQSLEEKGLHSMKSIPVQTKATPSSVADLEIQSCIHGALEQNTIKTMTRGRKHSLLIGGSISSDESPQRRVGRQRSATSPDLEESRSSGRRKRGASVVRYEKYVVEQEVTSGPADDVGSMSARGEWEEENAIVHEDVLVDGDFRNFNVQLTYLETDDVVIVGSDGLWDQFRPETYGLSPADAFKQLQDAHESYRSRLKHADGSRPTTSMDSAFDVDADMYSNLQWPLCTDVTDLPFPMDHLQDGSSKGWEWGMPPVDSEKSTAPEDRNKLYESVYRYLSLRELSRRYIEFKLTQILLPEEQQMKLSPVNIAMLLQDDICSRGVPYCDYRKQHPNEKQLQYGDTIPGTRSTMQCKEDDVTIVALKPNARILRNEKPSS